MPKRVTDFPDIRTASRGQMQAWFSANSGSWNKDQKHVGKEIIPFYDLYWANKTASKDNKIENQVALWDKECDWALDHMAKHEVDFTGRAWPFGFDVPEVATVFNKDARDKTKEAAMAAEKARLAEEAKGSIIPPEEKTTTEKGEEMLKKYGIYVAVGAAVLFFFLR